VVPNRVPDRGVFLDIAWIEERLSGSEEHIRRKLPSMYHQFKELADLDIPKTRWRSVRRRTT
jgi:succinate dehydrogenase / fumarate reductase flavoprotein subunit